MARKLQPLARSEGARPRVEPRAKTPVAVVVGLVLLSAAAVLVTWATSESAADLFMALAGGRDVVQGKLGSPDDWSFTTGGRVWINQNWLSHLLIYSTWLWGRDAGLLVLKAGLLAVMSALLFLVARRRGGHAPTAALLSAGIVLACFRFVLLRPNLMTLVLVPLSMLVMFRSFEDHRRIWWTVPLMAVWANLHGAFVFGLGMVGLWVSCALIEDWRTHGRANIRKHWRLPACLAACVVACALSPFGLVNLEEPLVVASSPGWRQVPEWLPLLSNDRMPFPWELFVVLGLVLALGLARLLSKVPARSTRQTLPPDRRAAFGPVAFEYVLLGAATLMAFQSRRFVPLAVLATAPPLARLLGWLALRKGRWVTIAACLGVIVPLLTLGWRNFQAYRPDHPIRTGSTIFDRMHSVSDVFPVSAGQFLGDNRLSGNALAAWEWEGYLRWVHPDTRLLMGGRAQQIYPPGVLDLWTRIQTTDQGPQLLRDNQVHLVIVPSSPRFSPLLSRLTATRQWASIYNDGRMVVLADARSEPTASLVPRAVAGQLKYPSEMTRALSLATAMLTGLPSPDPASILAAVRRANLAEPTPQAYQLLSGLAGGPPFGESAIAYLEQEAERLARLQPRGKGAQEMRGCRIMIQQVLAGFYDAASRGPDARQAENRAAALAQEAEAVRLAWR